MQFYHCEVCDNLAGMIHDSGVVPVCCDEVMKSLVANTVDASHEKHLPVVTISSDERETRVLVQVGSVPHPMTKEHLIEWIFIETNKGRHRRALVADDAPTASFLLIQGELPTAVYAYCNLHGLWKTAL
ncbi:MAG: desulfoferrodoxin [Proteobacteria bacterium]|nr:desulfoferrodoxin [Pseudomonadota bacterium]